jgi:mercuric ion transport protein
MFVLVGATAGSGYTRFMSKNSLFRIGIIGTVLAALCCFTPLLVVVLTAAGMAHVIPRLDPVLLPVMVSFAAFTFWAYSRRDDK